MLRGGFQQTLFAKFFLLSIQSFRNAIGVKQDGVAWSQFAFFHGAIPFVEQAHHRRTSKALGVRETGESAGDSCACVDLAQTARNGTSRSYERGSPTEDSGSFILFSWLSKGHFKPGFGEYIPSGTWISKAAENTARVFRLNLVDRGSKAVVRITMKELVNHFSDTSR